VHQELADQAALYALGALTGADKSAFEAHLSVCEECTAAVRGFAPIIEALAGRPLKPLPNRWYAGRFSLG
jgi:hypothetical protein